MSGDYKTNVSKLTQQVDLLMSEMSVDSIIDSTNEALQAAKLKVSNDVCNREIVSQLNEMKDELTKLSQRYQTQSAENETHLKQIAKLKQELWQEKNALNAQVLL